MDLGSNVSYNGFTASGLTTQTDGLPSRGVQFQRIDAQDVPAVSYFDKRAMQDGYDSGEVTLGGRSFNIAAAVYGSTAGDSWDIVQSVVSAFDPTNAWYASIAANTAIYRQPPTSTTQDNGFLPLTFVRPTADISTWPTSTYPSGVPLQMYVRAAGVPTYTIRKEATTLGFAIVVNIPMQARDPAVYLQATASVALTTATAGVTIPYKGTHPTWGLFSVSNVQIGTGGGVIVLIDSSSNTVAYIESDHTTTGGTAANYSIDTMNRVIRTVSTGALNNARFLGSTVQIFSPIRSGMKCKLLATGGGPGGWSGETVVLTYREAFLL